MKRTLPTGRARTLLSTAVPTQQPAPEDIGHSGDGHRTSDAFLARVALLTAGLSAAGSLLGLGRDQALAQLFGAGSETDAFLVAWTVPEVASTLLIEDGLAFMLVPAFSAAIAARAMSGPHPRAQDPVRALVAGSLPRLALAFLACVALLMVGARPLVTLLAPGLPDPQLAVDCTRLTATCVLTFGLAGYCSAALRAHSSYLPPAAIYVAYNTGIIAALLVLADHWGVRAAAAGVAVGGCLMVLVQAPSLLRRLRSAPSTLLADGTDAETPNKPDPAERAMNPALIATVLLFALCRQTQVLIERFLASPLPSGAISELNYAQKVAQLPMVLSLMLCTVTFPVVAKALARGTSSAHGTASNAMSRSRPASSCPARPWCSPAPRRSSNSSSNEVRSRPMTPRPPPPSCASTPWGCSGTASSGRSSAPTSPPAAPPGTPWPRWPWA